METIQDIMTAAARTFGMDEISHILLRGDVYLRPADMPINFMLRNAFIKVMHLPVSYAQRIMLSAPSETCVVCLEELGYKFTQNPFCVHSFHDGCFDKLSKCPLCLVEFKKTEIKC
jgi:hypothetical protein